MFEYCGELREIGYHPTAAANRVAKELCSATASLGLVDSMYCKTKFSHQNAVMLTNWKTNNFYLYLGEEDRHMLETVERQAMRHPFDSVAVG